MSTSIKRVYEDDPLPPKPKKGRHPKVRSSHWNGLDEYRSLADAEGFDLREDLDRRARRCLRCLEFFDSQHKGNRICGCCSWTTAYFIN